MLELHCDVTRIRTAGVNISKNHSDGEKRESNVPIDKSVGSAVVHAHFTSKPEGGPLRHNKSIRGNYRLDN